MKIPKFEISHFKTFLRFIGIIYQLTKKNLSVEKIEKFFSMARKFNIGSKETCKLRLTIYYVDGTVETETLPVQQADYRFSLICGAFCHSVTTQIDHVDVSDGRGMLLSRFSVLKHNLVCS